MHLNFSVYLLLLLTPFSLYSQNTPYQQHDHQGHQHQNETFVCDDLLDQFQEQLPKSSQGRLSELLIALKYWSFSIQRIAQARTATSKKIYTQIQQKLLPITSQNCDEIANIIGLKHLEILIEDIRNHPSIENLDEHILHFVNSYMNTNHSFQDIKESFAYYTYKDVYSNVSQSLKASISEKIWRKILKKYPPKEISFYMNAIHEDLHEILENEPHIQQQQVFERMQTLNFFIDDHLPEKWIEVISLEFEIFQSHYLDIHTRTDFQNLYERTHQRVCQNITEKKAKKILKSFDPHSLKTFLLEKTPECRKQLDIIHRIIFDRPYAV